MKEKESSSLEERIAKMSDEAFDVLADLLHFGPPHVQIKAVQQIIDLNLAIDERKALDVDVESQIKIYLPRKLK